MPRTFIACLMFTLLAAGSAAAQAPTTGLGGGAEIRRPAGRQLLDEAASERPTTRAAAAMPEEAADAIPRDGLTRVPTETEAGPLSPPVQPPSSQGNYPFDAPRQSASRYQNTTADQPVSTGYSPAALTDAPPQRFAPAATGSGRGAAGGEVMPAAYYAPPAADAIETPEQNVATSPVGGGLPLTEAAAPENDAQPIAAAADTKPATDLHATESGLVPPPSIDAAAPPERPQSDEQGTALALTPRGANAADVNATDMNGKRSAPRLADAKSPLITMVGSLALVLALFFALVWVMRRAAPSGLRLLPAEVAEVLGRAPLPGKQQQMHLVRCGRKLLLLASSPAGFETLTEITDPHEVDRLTAICRGEQPKAAEAAFRHTRNDHAHDSYGRGFDDDALESAASALSRRMGRSSRLEGSDV